MPCANAALAQRRLHLRSDVDVLPVFRGFEGQIFCVELHIRDLTPEFHPKLRAHFRVPLGIRSDTLPGTLVAQ